MGPSSRWVLYQSIRMPVGGACIAVRAQHVWTICHAEPDQLVVRDGRDDLCALNYARDVQYIQAPFCLIALARKVAFAKSIARMPTRDVIAVRARRL